MPIDFEMIEAMVAAGATGAVVLAFLKLSQHRTQRAQATEKPSVETTGKRSNRHGHKAQAIPTVDTKPQKDEGRSVVAARSSDSQAVDDTPVARLFREGAESLVALGVGDRTARQLIGKWRKLTNDDCQLISATINRAVELQVSDPAPWVLATLKGKVGNGKRNSTMEAFGELIAGVEGSEVSRDPGVIDLPVGSYQVS